MVNSRRSPVLGALFAIFPAESQVKTLFGSKIRQKVDEFSILCSVSFENLYEALSVKIFRLSAEFLAPPLFKTIGNPEFVEDVSC